MQSPIVSKIVFCILIIVMFTFLPTSSAGEIDYSMIGISEGDSYTFNVDKFYSDIENWGYYLGKNPDNNTAIRLSEGEHFTIKFNNLTIIEPSKANGFFTIPIEIVYNNISISQTNILNLGVGFLTPIDWNAQKLQLEADYLDVNSTITFDSFNFTTIDTSDEFGFMSETIQTINSRSSGPLITRQESETRYQKENGILNYRRTYHSSTSIEINRSQEAIVSRSGYNLPENNSKFDLLIVRIPLFPLVVITLIYLISIKSKNRSKLDN